MRQSIAGRFVGASINRVEDRRRLTGAGHYLDDVAVPGTLHATFLRRPYPHAELRAVDVTGARALPGVHLVLTGQDIKRLTYAFFGVFAFDGLYQPSYWALAVDRVRHVGDPVAIVVADFRRLAEDACEFIDVDVSFAAADRVIVERFDQHRQSNQPMEDRGIVAEVEQPVSGAQAREETVEVAAAAGGPISVRPVFDGGEGGRSCSTHACLVDVDLGTGAVRVLRHVVSEDCGEVINPAVVAGQIRGGVAQGIGAVLDERAAYDDDGQFQAGTFMDHLLPDGHGDPRHRDPPHRAAVEGVRRPPRCRRKGNDRRPRRAVQRHRGRPGNGDVRRRVLPQGPSARLRRRVVSGRAGYREPSRAITEIEERTMGQVDLTSTPDERIVAVFPDRGQAEMAADRARRSGGQDVAIDDQTDDVRALVGEMREETSESWGGPSVALYTPEMARHIPGPTAAAAVIGALIALPLAFLVGGGLPLTGRIALAMFCGAVGGGTIGFLAGGFLGARRRAVLDLADERGTVVGVKGGNPDAIRALIAAGPMRIDRVRGARPVDTVTSHERGTPSETVRGQAIPQDEP